MSSTELAIELREHCAAANDALKAVGTELSGAKPNLTDVRRKVVETEKRMDYCMKMVHGIAESTLGPGAEKEPSRR